MRPTIDILNLDLLDFRQIHLEVTESSPGTKTSKTWKLPIKKQGQIFFALLAKYWVSPPEDYGNDSVRVSINIAGNETLGDWSQPQTVDMYYHYRKLHTFEIDTGATSDPQTMKQIIDIKSDELHWLFEPIPYRKVNLTIQSTNSSVKAWAHVRLIGVIIDVDEQEWAFITSRYGQYR